MSDQEQLISISKDLQKLSDNFKSLDERFKEMGSRFKSLEDNVAPLTQAYQSVLFGKKFVVGIAVVISSIAAIGAAVLYIVNYVRHGS